MTSKVRLDYVDKGLGWLKSKLTKVFEFSLNVEGETRHVLESVYLQSNLDATVYKWEQYAKSMNIKFEISDAAKPFVSQYLWPATGE